MDALRLQPDVPNIPYMHLFHDLKQKFPFLKDSEINESIQKYGLDRERCIAELSQRNAILPGGYYGPWGRGSSGSGFSSPALSRVASPLRGGTPTTPTTTILTTTSNMMPQLHNTTATHLVLHPQSFTPNRTGSAYTSPRIISSPTSYQPPMGHPYGWSSVVSNGPCRSDMQTASLASGSNQDTPFSSRDPSRSPTPAMSPSSCPSPTSTLPSSAPVMITNYDPFCDYKNFNNGTLHRRNSEETVYNKKQGLFYNIQNYEQVKRLSLSPVRSQCSPLSDVPDLSSPSSPTTATVTTTTTTAATAAESSGPRTTAIVTEQSKRKEKLTEELNKSVEERNELESQVEKMKRDLEEREHQRKLNAESNARRIEDVQLENQRLQSECDQMESEILRVAPLTDTEEYVDTGKTPATTPVYEQPMSLPTSELSSHLAGGATGHIINSTAGSPMTAHAPMIPGAGFTPTRPAPPPPQPTSCTNPHTQGAPRNEESERNWSCSKCTFINHPGLNKCEMCEFPRFNIVRELP